MRVSPLETLKNFRQKSNVTNSQVLEPKGNGKAVSSLKTLMNYASEMM